jgi:hypothetical protein
LVAGGRVPAGDEQAKRPRRVARATPEEIRRFGMVLLWLQERDPIWSIFSLQLFRLRASGKMLFVVEGGALNGIWSNG